jgi:hypothetical protein
MNDIDLVAGLRPAVPLPDPDQLAPARDRLAAAIAAETGSCRGASNTGRRVAAVPGVRPRRLATWAAVGSAVAAAVVVAALVVNSAPAVAPSHPRPAGHSTLPARLTAAQWLTSAALAARKHSAVVPRPDQYVYSETVGPHGRSRYQIWLSVDGTRPGLVQPVGESPIPMTPCTVAQAEAHACSLEQGYLPDLPSSPPALFAFLVKIGWASTGPPPKPIPNWAANDLGKNIATLLEDEYLTPAQRGGLFELMAQTPGFRLVRHAVDAIGRAGVGIAWTYLGLANTIVFDQSTYALLGTTLMHAGRTEYADALITQAIVDKLPPTRTPTPRAKARTARSASRKAALHAGSQART